MLYKSELRAYLAVLYNGYIFFLTIICEVHHAVCIYISKSDLKFDAVGGSRIAFGHLCLLKGICTHRETCYGEFSILVRGYGICSAFAAMVILIGIIIYDADLLKLAAVIIAHEPELSALKHLACVCVCLGEFRHTESICLVSYTDESLNAVLVIDELSAAAELPENISLSNVIGILQCCSSLIVKIDKVVELAVAVVSLGSFYLSYEVKSRRDIELDNALGIHLK